MAVSVVKSVCKAMEIIAPLRLAEKWDNASLAGIPQSEEV